MQAGFIALMAVVFGIIASLVFAYFQPKFESLFCPEEEPVVTIPQDSVTETEQTEETETSEETEASEEPQAPSEEPPVQQPQELEIADVQNVQNKLYAVGREANRFVVTVTGVKSDTDWFNNSYESRGQASGIIIADNGQELLILTERKVISDAQEVYVTFINDVTVEASMKHYDGNTGIAVLSVPKERGGYGYHECDLGGEAWEFIDDDAGNHGYCGGKSAWNELLDPHGQHHIYQQCDFHD